MIDKRVVCLALFLASILCWSPRVCSAQETRSAAKSETTDNPANAYRLDFTMNELENGKKVNTRQYGLNVVPGFATNNELKIGTRIPVAAKDGGFQYLDMGTNLWSRMVEHAGAVQLEVRADLSTLADASQEKSSEPIIRQLRINSSTVVTLGKPMVIGTVDDPNSKRQYQLEVVVMKIR